jgi:hypothetical protein
MAWSEETLRRAWELARGRCECMREKHGHGVRCGRALVWGKHSLIGEEGWEARPWEPAAGDGPENVELLCMPCYQRVLETETRSGGGEPK